MSQETLDKIKEWTNANFWYDDNARSLAIPMNELEEYLETLVINQNQ